MSERASSDGPSALGCIVASSLVLLPGVAMSLFGPSVPGEELPFALFLGVIFALPFGYLALATRRWVPWALTLFFSACIWGALIFVTALGAPGVSFWIVALMLAAPTLITAGAAAAVRVTS